MKHLFLLLLCSAACLLLRAQVTNPGQVAQQDASNHANNDVNSSINNSLSKTESTIKGLFKKKSKTPKPDSTAAGSSASNSTQGAAASGGASSSGPATLKTYSNYDFVPGEQVVFEDNFTDDQDGEFPAHWRLNAGQAIINKVDSAAAFFLTEGNYVRVAPRMKTEKDYLPENFTIEFDFYSTPGAYKPVLLFTTSNKESRNIGYGTSVETSYFPHDFSGTFPGDHAHFDGHWHHAAMIK